MAEPPTNSKTTTFAPTEKRGLLLGFGFIPRVLSPDWWRFVAFFLLHCPRYLLKPSMMLAIGLTLPYVGLDMALRPITQHGTYNGLMDVILTFAIPLILLLLGSIGSLVLATWGLAASLLAVTAMCRTFLTLKPELQNLEKSAVNAMLATSLDESMAYFKQRRSFLVVIWLMYSALMATPSVLLFVAGTIVLTGMPMIGTHPVIPLQFNFPPEIIIASAITVGVTLIVMSNYALILLPYSSKTEYKGTQASIHGFALALKTLPGITLYSALAFTISSFLCSPIDLLVIYNQDLATNDLARYFLFVLKAAWHILFFTYLLPLSLLIPCEMIRDNTD